MIDRPMKETIARAAFRALYDYDAPGDMSPPYGPHSKIGKAWAVANAMLDALCEPTLGMTTAAYEGQPDAVNAGFAQAFTAMIQAARDGH